MGRVERDVRSKLRTAGTYGPAKVTRSRKQGFGEKATWSARSAQALLGAVPRRRFGYFAAAGKVTPSSRRPEAATNVFALI